MPKRAGLDGLRRAAAGCTACHLHELGTQTVFGEGPRSARIMLVGEQPGDREDIEGRPFVGPAGRLLDRALDDAGIPRDDVYVTNAVKHFKWRPRGPRRIHDTPNEREMAACRPWLRAEIRVVDPLVVVCLGATAARSLLGRDFRLTRHRGELFQLDGGPRITATLHPSAILRGPPERRAELLAGVADDLRAAAAAAR
ncbi:UdgX family uracil-DNA binding protein [Miltoncostaea marina]|uniref:UdgX family uracil-DNA binding protein n=1 Tax=Miltoncostaea marina TaxID=2843215 RepID=UPI001C3CA3E4|nr:UdgX family uracil-DNA binding protein [Miltoncostaea marina]